MLFILWCDNCVWPSGTWLVFHVIVTTVEMQHPPPPCTHVCCLVSTNVQQVSVNAIFSPWRNLMTDLCFIHISVSDAILSAAVCLMATKCHGILVGRLNLYCHATDIHKPAQLNRRHYFQSSSCKVNNIVNVYK